MSAAAEKALRQIMTLAKRADFATGREIRYLEIALEGVGMAPAQREAEIQAVVQRRRNRIAEKQAAREGVPT